MKRFTVANTVQIGLRAIVAVSGRPLPNCVQAFAIGPFIFAEVHRTCQDGTPILFDTGFKTRWVCGFGSVIVEPMA